ncbi:TD and POZ domain-containing protein 4 [Trichonephila clavipes]|nr:TD and POZ domain-containing protein 4 [Trichonephila clavipes]
MVGEIRDEEYEFLLWWSIENYRYCWQKYQEPLFSPIFTTTSMENTKWRLILYPAGLTKQNYIGFFLQREKDEKSSENVEISFALEFLGSDGSILKEMYSAQRTFGKEGNCGLPECVERKRVLQLERDRFLPLNILTVRCRMRRSENRSQECVHMCAKTVINFQKMSSVGAIEKFSSLKLDQRVPFLMKSAFKE